MEPYIVSVIIPCFNVSKYVGEAISSIINQSYQNIEILVIDDGSTDNTLEKISEFEDPRLKVFSFKENTKKVGAVNDVLKQAKGDFICFQDSDDTSEPDRIKKQLGVLEKDSNIGICFTNYTLSGKKKIIPKISLSNEELRREFLDFGKESSMSIFPTVCATMMFSAVVLKETNGYHEYFRGRVAEDIHWVYRILKKFRGCTIDEQLYNYRQRAGSLTDILVIGKNAKFCYSVSLLSKIIHKDIYENIDVLKPENSQLIKDLELEACEDELVKTKVLLVETIKTYERSFTYRLGKSLLKPLRIFRNIK